MNIRSLFKENLLLEVFDPGQEIYYKSIIQEVHDDYIAIGMPLRKQKNLSMAKNSSWEFRLAQQDTLYYFRTRCVGSKKEDNIPLYLIKWPDEVRRVQRREFFRFPCSFDTHYWVLKKPWEEEEQLPPIEPDSPDKEQGVKGGKKRPPLEKLAEMIGDPGEAMIADISGGGVQLVASQWMPMGTILLLCLFLKSKGKEKTIFVKGKVVWVGAHQPERTVRFKHAVEYEDISERTKEEIVGFIFVLMRERMA